MKVSEMIKNLQEFMEVHGDLECYYAIDDEGNTYHPVYYDPSMYYLDEYHSLAKDGIISWERFDFAFFSYLDNGTPVDSNLIWNRKATKKLSLLDRIKRIFTR